MVIFVSLIVVIYSKFDSALGILSLPIFHFICQGSGKEIFIKKNLGFHRIRAAAEIHHHMKDLFDNEDVKRHLYITYIVSTSTNHNIFKCKER